MIASISSWQLGGSLIRAEQERLRGGVHDPGLDQLAGRLPCLPPVSGGQPRGHEVPAQVGPADQISLMGGHREDHPVEQHPDGVRRLAEAGVTDLIIGFRWPYVTGPDTAPLKHKLASLRHFADTVIAR